MMQEASADTPLLVVESVSRDTANPSRMVAAIRMAGHPLRVLLDFESHQGIAEFVEMPWLLEIHPPSQRAVLDVMAAVASGRPVAMPADLSGQVSDASPPFPLRAMPPDRAARLETEAGDVSISVLHAERSPHNPVRIAAGVELNGRIVHLEVEIYAGLQGSAAVRWIAGPDPETFSQAERYAIRRALLNAVE